MTFVRSSTCTGLHLPHRFLFEIAGGFSIDFARQTVAVAGKVILDCPTKIGGLEELKGMTFLTSWETDFLSCAILNILASG